MKTKYINKVCMLCKNKKQKQSIKSMEKKKSCSYITIVQWPAIPTHQVQHKISVHLITIETIKNTWSRWICKVITWVTDKFNKSQGFQNKQWTKSYAQYCSGDNPKPTLSVPSTTMSLSEIYDTAWKKKESWKWIGAIGQFST